MGNGLQMEKIKSHSLKWSFAKYMIPCVLISIIGILIIGHGTNYIQEWYYTNHLYSMSKDFEKNNIIEFYNYRFEVKLLDYDKETVTYWIICNAQAVLMPLWAFLCIGVAGMFFYNHELREPINKLMEASEKISENQLDFKIEYGKQNELGTLCKAFDDMRLALYENNREMWKSLEERKRLNSAFSHDLRTPLTVLRGYVDFLQQYLPDGKVSEEKLMNVLSMMNGQIIRLEHYTQKMNAIQKLEDIIPDIQLFSTDCLFKSITDTGRMICSGKNLHIETFSDTDVIFIDNEIVIQVCENILSNTVRYTENCINMVCGVSENMLTISVYDDGKGFTETALKNAAEPFFRDEKNSGTHFGLGLYICRVLCEKCNGHLIISNYIDGGKVTAEFFCGKFSENR